MEQEIKNVYIGSTNIIKIKACREVIEPFGYQVIGKQANSQVSNQPKSDEETLLGAINRALNLKEGYLRIGLEAGVTYQNNILFLVNWGALIDENENIYVAGGTRIPLPKPIEKLIFEQNLELADAMDQYYNTTDIKHHSGTIGFFTEDQIKREEIFIHIVKLLYGQYLHFKATGEK